MSKDWTGNKRALTAMLAINGEYNTKYRETNDFYATDPKAMDELLKVESFNKNIWENACGQGNLAKVLEQHGYSVKATDLVYRGYGTGGVDFLMCKEKWYGDIITNPPYKYANEFVKHSLELVNDGAKIAMFFKITFLEGKKRYVEIFKENPPKRIWVASFRLECGKNNFFSGNGMSCYAWFVWEKGYKGKPEIGWINTGENENELVLF